MYGSSDSEKRELAADVAASGALALQGLWAVGTCVDPDVDHTRSLQAGEVLGRAVAGAAAKARSAANARAFANAGLGDAAGTPG